MKTQLASPAGVPRHALDEEKTEAILGSITIPPQPSELGELQQALSSGFLDNEMIIAALRSAVSVSNELIGIINTPFFGYADKIETIQEAIESLGQSNIVNIANAISLKQAFCGSDYVDMEHYFCLADDCALVAAGIARELDILDPVQTYNLALLHDCGIPVLLHTFPNYAEILQLAFTSSMYTLTEYEDNNLNINHAMVSHFICKTWGLSGDTGSAILHHHDIEGSLLSTQQQKSDSQTLIALLTMAEYISYAYHGRAGKTCWPEDASIVLDYLGLSEFDFERIKAQMFAKFAA